MKTRTRVALWFSVVLLVAMTATVVFCYYEFVLEPREHGELWHRMGPTGEPDLWFDIIELFLLCFVPVLVIALSGGWWLMRQALRPVIALTQAAEQTSEHQLRQELPHRLDGDEIDRLTAVFNRMTGRLDDSFRRTRQMALHASHELKMPLTVMHAELETWMRDGSLDAAARVKVENLLDEIQRLVKIVDGVTLLAKCNLGQVALRCELVRLDELVREAAEDAQSLARPAGVQVNVNACPAISLNGDRHRLRQLLLILCDNAVKYNQPGGRVDLELSQSASRAELKITNTGPGIPAENLSRLFEPFFRGDASHSQTIEGCGLGLSIARWIVAAHGGGIEVASTPGQQTIFAVKLPAEAPA